MLDVFGSCQLLNSAHVRERHKALLRSVMVDGVWNGFLLGRVRGQPVPCRCRGTPEGDGHFFGRNVPPLVEIRENPEFHDLMRMHKAHWPRCIQWHGWLPVLSGANGASPWAVDASDSAVYLVEAALGRYSSGLIAEWSPPHGFDAVGAARSGHWCVCFWCCFFFFAHQWEHCWRDRRWGHVGRVRTEGAFLSSRGFCSVPGSLQTVQRAELWGVILALQSSVAVHLGLTIWVRHLFNLVVLLILVGVLCLSLVLCRLFRGLSCGESLLLFSLLMLFTLVLTSLVLFSMLENCLMLALLIHLLSLSLMVIFFCSFRGCFVFGVMIRFGLLR